MTSPHQPVGPAPLQHSRDCHTPLLLGHRGARAHKAIPENTFGSFDRALADGCDGFEFDVRLTADGQAVICHDAKIGKLPIARARADQLTDLPRLDQVLARYRDSFLDIELKVTGLEHIVIGQLPEFSPQHFVISSFLPEVLETLYALNADLPLGLICETERQLNRWRKLPIAYVMPHYKIAGKTLIRELHLASRKVLVWTVNRARAMRQFAEWEVDGIISDDTALLGKMLSR